ncbi:hypothetical protein ACULLL_20225 [Lysinibacillus irui]|uniref:hypothetical protein n=1 Tax=Lysinibacillus irui TaxID=2998077 RepID=UPI0040448253
MKKGLVILLGILLLSGCSSKDTVELKTRDEEVSDKVVAPEESHENDSGRVTEEKENHENFDGTTEEKENLKDVPAAGDTIDTVTNNDDLGKFAEFDTIEEHIDLDTFQGVVETDNKGNRIIIFEDENGSAEYKSIFIKHDNRLKIVKLKDDGLLYNGIIK